MITALKYLFKLIVKSISKFPYSARSYKFFSGGGRIVGGGGGKGYKKNNKCGKLEIFYGVQIFRIYEKYIIYKIIDLP